MPHFMSLVDNTSLGALNFTDGDMNPVERQMTIKGMTRQKPPAGKAEKACMVFEETPKVWFIPTGQMKRLANMLMIADYSRWAGVKVVLTCGPVKSPKGGDTTMGIIIVRAERPNKQPSQPIATKQGEPSSGENPQA